MLRILDRMKNAWLTWRKGAPCSRCGVRWNDHVAIGNGWPPIRHCAPPMPELPPPPSGWSDRPGAPLAPVLRQSGRYLRGDAETRTYVVVQMPAPTKGAVWTTLYSRVLPFGNYLAVAHSSCEYQARIDNGECGATYEFTARCLSRYGIEGDPSPVLVFTTPMDVALPPKMSDAQRVTWEREHPRMSPFL